MLEEAGRPMHIKEIKQRIIDRGLVQSKYNKVLSFPLSTSHIELDSNKTFIANTNIVFFFFLTLIVVITVQSRVSRQSCIVR